VIKNDSLYTIFSTLLTDKITTTLDFESFDTAGQNRIYQARTSQLRNDDGAIHGIIILMQDVTQERQLEQMKTDFLAMAAHELSTPLTTIIGYAELLHSEDFPALTPEIQQESLEFIHNKANALARIVDDLLDVSRAESGQELSINKVSFDLNRSLESMVKDYKKRNSGHFILYNQSDTDGKIFADPTRFDQVLDNLLSNALKYTPDGGHIRISNRRDGDFHEIIITDDGIGMTSGQLEHIFDKFYRADASNTAKPGIGLGMSLTKHIIEGHSGTITVTSEPNQGTQVVIRLPHLLPKQ
jgi:signal transduction histidine kinase